MIVRAFSITIAAVSMPNTVSQAMHSDAGNITKDEIMCCSCKKEENDENYDRLTENHFTGAAFALATHVYTSMHKFVAQHENLFYRRYLPPRRHPRIPRVYTYKEFQNVRK